MRIETTTANFEREKWFTLTWTRIIHFAWNRIKLCEPTMALQENSEFAIQNLAQGLCDLA